MVLMENKHSSYKNKVTKVCILHQNNPKGLNNNKKDKFCPLKKYMGNPNI